MKLMFTTDATSVFYGILLAIITIFFQQAYSMVKKMALDIRQVLIENAKRDEQIKNIDDRLETLEIDVREIKEHYKN